MRYAGVALILGSTLLGCGLVGCGSDDPPVTEDTGSGDTGSGDTGTTSDSTIDSTIDSTTDSTATESGGDSTATDSTTETADSTATDSTATDSTATDSAAADTKTDSTAADSTVADSAATDSAADTTAADTTAADTTAADTTAADTTAADTTTADSASDAATDSAEAATDAGSDASFGTAPTCDGTLATGEYGDHTEGKNQYSSSTQTWYARWDDTNLYVAITNANVAEAAVVYLEKAPLTPATSGTNADGNLGGQTYDGARYSSLPFRADLVAYVKSGYREYRTADGTGGWSSATAGAGCFASAGTTREFSIPWSAVGGRPASFSFFGYVVAGSGFVYGQVPTTLAAGAVGTTATAGSYFLVTDSSAAAAAKPFATPKP
ncbi:MAG: hypothetical protein JNL79_23340 [Myxococcales bacterium]|nr:hypothetical protein [Myxococcales bacterium]